MIERRDAVAEQPRFEVRVRYGHGIEGVRDVFSQYRINAAVQPVVPYMDYPNEMLFKAAASILIIGSLTAFLNAFAGEAGKAAFTRMTEFLRDLRGARGDKVVLLSDRDSKVAIRLDDDASDEAMRQLFELDLGRFADLGTLRWDADSKMWEARKGRQRRADISGWFAPDGAVDQNTTWHLTAGAGAVPLITLCGDVLEAPQHVEGNQWLWAGRPCLRCVDKDPAVARRDQ